MGEFRKRIAELVEVVHDNVGGGAFANEAAVLEAGARRRQRAQPPMSVFQAGKAPLPHQVRDILSAVTPAGQILGMRAAVGQPGDYIWIVYQLLDSIGGDVELAGLKDGFEPVGHGYVADDVD